MAIINTTYKWLYLMEPHTASRATAKLLKDQLGGSEVGHHHISVRELTDRRRTASVHNIHNYKILCTIRNPFDVLVTQWKYSGHAHKPIDEKILVARYGGTPVYNKKRKEANNYLPFLDWVIKNIEHPMISEPLKGLWKECHTCLHYENINQELSEFFDRPLALPENQAHITKDKLHWSNYWVNVDGAIILDKLLYKYDHFLKTFNYNIKWADGGPFCSLC